MAPFFYVNLNPPMSPVHMLVPDVAVDWYEFRDTFLCAHLVN